MQTRHQLQKLYNATASIFETIISLITVIFFSSLKEAKKAKAMKRTTEECVILGNGPSLKLDAERVLELSKKHDTFCVNTFYVMDLFWKVKPRYYLFIDPALFDTSERRKKLREGITAAFKKVDWGMYLIIPTFYKRSPIVNALKSEYVKILTINTIPINKGWKGLRFKLYNLQLGMPKSQNVLNCGVYLSILWKYKEVYLFGADHSWMRDLVIDDDNYVCFVQRHAFDKGKEDAQVTRSKDYKISILLRDWANMFESHLLLADYAKAMNVKIYNCTKGSYIDAYQRCYEIK